MPNWIARIPKFIVIFFLWILFSLGSIAIGFLTPIWALFYPWMDKNGQNAKRVESSDRGSAAWWFGYSGLFTLSLECAFEKQKKRTMFIKRLIDYVDSDHCNKSAKSEGAFRDFFNRSDE